MGRPPKNVSRGRGRPPLTDAEKRQRERAKRNLATKSPRSTRSTVKKSVTRTVKSSTKAKKPATRSYVKALQSSGKSNAKSFDQTVLSSIYRVACEIRDLLDHAIKQVIEPTPNTTPEPQESKTEPIIDESLNLGFDSDSTAVDESFEDVGATEELIESVA